LPNGSRSAPDPTAQREAGARLRSLHRRAQPLLSDGTPDPDFKAKGTLRRPCDAAK